MGSTSKPNIHDVARLAGVSTNTVSRVLNGKSGVGESTRGRVARIIRELGYIPNMGARALRGARTGCIGVSLPAPADVAPISHTFLAWIFEELHRLFGQKGERICFDLNPFADNSGEDYARGVWENLYTACLFVGPLHVGDTVIPRVHDSGVPYLVTGRLYSFPECSSAAVDFELATYLSTKHLIDRGHKRIGMLKPMSDYQPAVERIQGYARACEEAGIETDEKLIRPIRFGGSDILNAVYRLLVDRSVTAVVDSSGAESGTDVREGARRAGRKLGSDLDVVTWTYTSDSIVLPEACAHVWIPIREATSEGMELLAEWHMGRRSEPIKVLYPATLYAEATGELLPSHCRLFFPSR
ncbi:MAG: LacI family DNA-binding transcriptional regulator [Candidatus Hydrogenedentes bacterium]|nr:LacI family DNA-binding transcriptional regulator [Candidatus Hydrogenedentota bacterium]